MLILSIIITCRFLWIQFSLISIYWKYRKTLDYELSFKGIYFETNMLLIFQITSGSFTYTDNFVKWDTLTWTKCLLVYYYEGCIIFSCFIRNPLKPSLYLQNDLLPEGTISGQNRHGYTISNVDRFHAGRYTCHADNGVGAAATAKIALQVLCKYKSFFLKL